MRKLLLLFMAIFVAGCTKKQYSAQHKQEYTSQFYKWMDEQFDASIDRYPMWQTYMGIKKDYDKLNDISDEKSKQELEISKKYLKELNEYDGNQLTEQGKLSLKLAIRIEEQEIADFKYRFHNYPVNQMFGIQSDFPEFFINNHLIADKKDAEAYIKRILASKEYFNQFLQSMKIREDQGILPPKFIFPHVYRDISNILEGKPFNQAKKDSTILQDFKSKLRKIKITKKERANLVSELEKALNDSFKPAYERLLSYLKKIEPKTDDVAGVWKLPQGAEYYKVRLQRMTTTDKTASEIHQIGLSEVARIHEEMNAIKDKVKFKGSLQEFFKHLRGNKNLHYPETKVGRQSYLDQVKIVAKGIDEKLEELFSVRPEAQLKIKPVEAFREKSAGKAFYSSPAPDGSRPGIYFVNLYDMSRVPKYDLEALYYHEGIPGHHMQNTIAMETKGLPKFRKYMWAPAFGEGWGLYAELLPKEIGFYQDPYSDFGRLSMELWRAARLVVDTGVHSKKWTREKAIDYLNENTPNSLTENTKAIERYIVMPAQATAYKMGMLKILELRAYSKQALGDRFDIREFHDMILQNGALPLDVLEELVKSKVKEKLKNPAKSKA